MSESTAAPAAGPASTETFTSFSNKSDSPGNVVSERPIAAKVASTGSDIEDVPDIDEGPASKDVSARAEPKPKAEPKAEAKAEPEKPAAKPRYKVKVDGEESELDVDDIIAGFQRNAASTKRMQEAAALRREAESMKQELQSAFQQLQQRDPIEAARLLGFNDQQIAAAMEAHTRRQLELAKLSPKDRQIIEYQEQLAALQQQKAQTEEQLQSQLAAQQQAQAQAQQQQEIAAYAAQVDKEMPEVMQKYGLGNNAATAALMTRVMLEQFDAGNTSFSLDDAAAVTREWIQDSVKAVLREDLPVEVLRGLIPESVLTKVRQAAVAQSQAPAQGKPQAAPRAPPRKQITSFAKEYETDLYSESPDPIVASYGQ